MKQSESPKNKDNKSNKAKASQPGKATQREEADSTTAQQLQDVLKQLTPLTDFHEAVKDASQDDLRMSWDVRIMRGEDTAFCHVKGTTSLPALLASNMVAKAPARMQVEFTEKVLEPIVARMQSEAEKITFENLATRKGSDNSIQEDECFTGKGKEPTGQDKAANPTSPDQPNA